MRYLSVPLLYERLLVACRLFRRISDLDAIVEVEAWKTGQRLIDTCISHIYRKLISLDAKSIEWEL
jgi:hypothetical protein